MAIDSRKKQVEKAKKQLMEELESLRSRVAELEESRPADAWAEDAWLKNSLVTSAAIDDMPDGVILVDMSGDVIYVNRAFESLLGYVAEELIGKPALALPTYRGTADKALALGAMKELMESGNSQHVDIGAVSKDGEEIAISFAASVMRDAHGNPRALVSVLRDVTERTRAEKKLKEREENFRVLIDNSLDISVIVNPDQTIRYVSPSVERTLGYDPAELVGRNAFDFLSPADVDYIARNYETLARQSDQDTSVEVRFRHKDGSWRTLEGVANNLTDDPTVAGIVVNARDVSDRKQAEEALRQRESYFRALIENSLDDVAILDGKGRILHQSPSIQRVLGYAPGEHASAIYVDFVHQDDRERVALAFEELLKNPGSTFQGEMRAQHRDGSCRTLEVMVRNFLDDPLVGGILANFRDVTERKMAEEERVAHAAALARAEELLVSRQRMLAVQESVRRDIAQQIHGSVQNRLIILLHRLTELERVASAKDVSGELGDLRQKLSDLLDNEVRSISHRLYPSILRRGLIAALQSLGDQFEAAMDVEMRLDQELARMERTTPTVIVEPVRLAAYRIVEEALTNAVKHAGASRVMIDLHATSEGWIDLTVRNDGRGFDMSRAPAGLGILMMQDYAEVAGGRCTIHSSPREGTEVNAILPLEGPGAESPETSSSSE